jgi:hypothetical protein
VVVPHRGLDHNRESDNEGSMRSLSLKTTFFALAIVAAAPTLSYAADYTPIQMTHGPASVPVAEDTLIIEHASPVLPAPIVRYGCKRVWRCDAAVCEWRRGCWGIYGYMEGPYNTLELARRQWERHGWPVPATQRTRITISK